MVRYLTRYTQPTGVQLSKVASILIKLLMDMWLAGTPQSTFAPVLTMLQAALRQQDLLHRSRVFDLVYNLSLHAHMIESDNPGAPAATDSARSSAGTGMQPAHVAMAPRLVAFTRSDGRAAAQAHVYEPSAVRTTLLHALTVNMHAQVCARTQLGSDGLVKGLRQAVAPVGMCACPAILCPCQSRNL